jgi:photosystem II stability/assembly factor-like uncharacterized protein
VFDKKLEHRSMTRKLLVFLTFALTTSLIAVKAYDDRNTAGNTKEIRQWEATGPWGGDVRELVASPVDSNLLYLGTSDGQIYRSTDGATSWHRLKPGIDRRGVSVDCIEIDPSRPSTIYVGVWSLTRDEQGGVFKSEDGGDHWSSLEGTRKFSVRSLAISPSDPNIVIAGTANDDPQLNGVFRSTDAGKNWSRISPVGDREIRNIESCAIDPRDPNIIYIGTWHLAWKSVDGGAAWKQTGDPQTGVIDDSDIFGITIDPQHPTLLYMNACSGIYRSNSAGDKWAKIPGIPFSARRTYALLTHPSRPEIILAGTSEGLWRSKDGGKRWSLLTSKNIVVRAIVITPDKPDRVLMATDDFGVRVSQNLGDDFIEANTGFIHRHILSILPDASERGRVLASVYHDGSGGSVFLSKDGGENWEPSSQGLGTRDVFAFYQMPKEPDLVYAGTNTGVFKSTDRGSSWLFAGTPVPAKPAPVRKPARSRRKRALLHESVGRYETVPVSKHSIQKKRGPSRAKARTRKPEEPASTLAPGFVELTSQVDDITSFVDLEGRRGLLAATQNGLYRTFDESKGWEKVAIAGYDPAGRVFAVSVHPDTPMRIFAGTRQGLFVSNDGGATWDYNDRGPVDLSVKAIAQDPRDAQLIIVGTNQYVYRSTNGGRTWTRRGGGLPAGDFTSVVINAANPDEVIAADYARGGVFRSMDKGYDWERIDSELPMNRVWTLTFDPFERDRIYAGSFSSGVCVLTIQRAATTSSH